MKVAIIGAGFGGLAIAYRLAQKGIDVSVLESGENPGGLAVGFKKPNWAWSLEHHYHHWFTNDYSVLDLAREIGHTVHTVRPKTSTYIDERIYQLDSALSLLTFGKLPLVDRIRTGGVIAYLKATNSWKKFEKVTSKDFIIKYMGQKSWEVLWKPLFAKKFDKYADEIPASWFWARIKKRTPSLAYPEGGFLEFASTLSDTVVSKGGKIYYKTLVNSIKYKNNEIVVNAGKNDIKFDKIVVTLPNAVFVKLTEGLPAIYIDQLSKVKGIGAVNLVLTMKKPFLTDGTYWLNINELKYPFLAVVEHTNFMNKLHYDGENLVYIGNYLPVEHKYFAKDAASLLHEFTPYLKKINPEFDTRSINDAFLFKAGFAQPIVPLNYSKIVPDFKTPIPNIYLCNMSQVYPWDRGTNYAVENGERVADLVLKSV